MKKFHYIPPVTGYDLTIDENNLVMAWKKKFNILQTEEWFNEAKSFDDFEEENILWDILCEATQDNCYPVFRLHPDNSRYTDAYTITEIEEEFDLDFYNFCWGALQEVAKDLGLLY